MQNVIFRVPLSQVRPQRIKAVFYRVRSLALYEPRFQPHIFTWLLTAVVIALIMESAMLSSTSRHTAAPLTSDRLTSDTHAGLVRSNVGSLVDSVEKVASLKSLKNCQNTNDIFD
jgi:hypothetical protein